MPQQRPWPGPAQIDLADSKIPDSEVKSGHEAGMAAGGLRVARSPKCRSDSCKSVALLAPLLLVISDAFILTPSAPASSLKLAPQTLNTATNGGYVCHCPRECRGSGLLQTNMGRFDMEVPFSPQERTFMAPENRINLREYLLAHGGEDVSAVIEALAGAVREISALCDRANLDSCSGSANAGSKQAVRASYEGETVKLLDELANEAVNRRLASCPAVAAVASEEEDEALSFRAAGPGRFAVVHDPLDGSSNIEAGIPVGTIFGILPTESADITPGTPKLAAAEKDTAAASCLQAGSCLRAAGYALYGPRTDLVVAWTDARGVPRGAHMFTLERRTGEFVLTREACRIPARLSPALLASPDLLLVPCCNGDESP
jgi:hypothetical protein